MMNPSPANNKMYPLRFSVERHIQQVKSSAEKSFVVESSFDKENSFTRTHQHFSGEKALLSINQQSRELLAEIHESQQKLTLQEMEDRLVMLATENDRLQRLLAERDRELQTQSQHQALSKNHHEEKLRQLETKTTKLILENEKVVHVNESLSKQLEQLHLQVSQLTSQHAKEMEKAQHHYESQSKSMQMEQILNYERQMNLQIDSIVQEHQEKLSKLTKEFDCVMIQKKELLTQYQTLQHHAASIESSAQDKIKQLSKQLEILVQENEKTAQLAEFKAKELEKNKLVLHSTIEESNRKHQILQQSIQQFQSNIQSYQSKVQYQQEEIGKLTQRIVELNSQYEQVNSELNTQLQTTEECYQTLQQYKHSEQNIRKAYEEIQASEQQLQQQYAREMESHRALQGKMDLLLKENNKLNVAFQERLNEAQLWQQRYQHLQSETNTKISQQTANFDLRAQEIQSVVTNNFKEQVACKDREIHSLTERINLLVNQIDLLGVETKRQQQIAQESQSELDQLKPRQAALSREIERLRNQLAGREEEQEKLRQQVIKLQSNYEIQHNEEHSAIITMQVQYDELEKETIQLRQQKQQLKLSLEEAGANLASVQTLLSETHNKCKTLQAQEQIILTELQELRALRPQMTNISTQSKQIKQESNQRQELETLKKQYEQAIKIRVEREVALERERHVKYQVLWEADKRNLETRVQSLLTENDILKQDIASINLNFQHQVQDIQNMQQNQLNNINHQYNCELKGLTHKQQLEFSAIIFNLQQQIQSLTNENQTLMISINEYQQKLTIYESQQSTQINTLYDKIYALEKDNARLIDEKVGELSRNTQLQTQLRRLTPSQNPEYINRQGQTRKVRNYY